MTVASCGEKFEVNSLLSTTRKHNPRTDSHFGRNWGHTILFSWNLLISTKKSHITVFLDHVLIPMASTVKMSSLPIYEESLEGLPCDQLSEGQRLESGLLMVLHAMQAPPRRGKLQCYKPFLGQCWKTPVRGESSLWAELHVEHMVWHFSWREKWPDVQFTDSWAVVNGLAVWLARNMERAWLECWWERHLKKMQTELSEWAKDMKIFVFYVNAQPKVTSAEEFSNQVY